MKLNIVLLIFFLFVKNIQAQQTGHLLYNDIPVLFNIDSVEKAVATTPKNNALELFLALVTLEKSRYCYYSTQFGNNLAAIDSLAKTIGTNDVKAISLWLTTKHQLTNNNNKELAAKICNAAIELATKQKDTTLLLYCYHSLMMLNISGNSSTNNKIGGTAKSFAKKYFTTISQLAANTNKPINKILYNTSCVEYYFEVALDDANVLKAANRGLEIIENNPTLIYFKGYFLASIASYYKIINNDKKSLEYSMQCLSMPTIVGSSISVYYNFNIASSYLTLLEYDTAKLYCKKAIQLIKTVDTNNLLLLDYCYSLLSQIEYGQKNYKTAYDIKLLDDSVYNVRTSRENQTKFVELEHKYESDKKDQANAILNQKQAQYKMLGIIGLLVFMFIVAMLFLFYKQNKKLVKLVIFRDKIHTIISHDLRSPFAALQDLNEQASHYLKTNDIKQFNNLAFNIDSTSIKISNLLNNLLQWAITTNKKERQKKVNLNVAAVINGVIQLYSNTIENKKIIIQKSLNNSVEVIANKNVIELIIRNWLDNTLKYSNATKLNFEIEKNAYTTKILIQDNGSIDNEIAVIIKKQLAQADTIKIESDTGLGLGLIAYFAKEHNIIIIFNAMLNNNVFIIEIPNNV